MSTKVQLKEGQSFVEGRSEELARELIELATPLGLQSGIFTTSFGYIVPSAILEGQKVSDPAAGEENAEDEPNAVQFDPSQASIAEIEDYLDGADDAEAERVFAAEKAGKNRKGVFALAESSEGAK
jgi:hypothetical protein